MAESVGDYQFNRKDLIGHGAFAVVFKGRHKDKQDLPVAVKAITKKNIAKSRSLLEKEIKILEELTKLQHENIVCLLDCRETPQNVYIVMEYCNGGDLADYMLRRGTLSEDTIRLFTKQICRAILVLQTKGIIHRDLKPQNILLSHDSSKSNPSANEITLKIADFGFARFLGEGVMAATLCGSPQFMAVEILLSKPYDSRADLWSLGTIIYQCLTGRAPFEANTPQALRDFYKKNLDLQPTVPQDTSPELKDLLCRLLRRNPEDRISLQDVSEHPFLQPPKTQPMPILLSKSMGQSPPQQQQHQQKDTSTRRKLTNTPVAKSELSDSSETLVGGDFVMVSMSEAKQSTMSIAPRRSSFGTALKEITNISPTLFSFGSPRLMSNRHQLSPQRQSSDNSSPPVFYAPELAEETLLDEVHNGILAELNFVEALAGCILDLADSRSALIAPKPSFKLPIGVDKFVLYFKASQLISSALEQSRTEMKANRLRNSSSVRQVLRLLRFKFHHCLNMLKTLNYKTILATSEGRDALKSIDPDKVLYECALEMCKTAASEEMFNQPEESIKCYQTAHILLHGLIHQMSKEDKPVLENYRVAVEKRLLMLQQRFQQQQQQILGISSNMGSPFSGQKSSSRYSY